jgi:hypothetical protein
MDFFSNTVPGILHRPITALGVLVRERDALPTR